MERSKITATLAELPAVEAVVLYGPGEEHLLIVTRDLELATLRAVAEPVRAWVRKTSAWPRLLTRALIEDGRDVFALEMLELSQRRRVLHGPDPFAAVSIDRHALRVQCERELREKLMRLREAYIELTGDVRALRQVIDTSEAAFARIFRGCLVLLDETVPVRDHDVIRALCRRLDLDPAAFFDGHFPHYYRALSAMAERIDRMIIHPKEAV